MRNDDLAMAVRLREEGRKEEARTALLALAERYPDDAEVACHTAWVHDSLGLEAEAVPYYERALAGDGLTPGDRLGAFTGLGSTLRVLGRVAESRALFRRALEEFPGDPGLRVFEAMALYNAGESREAVSALLKLLVEAGHVGGYERAVAYYADNLDETV
ncbi:tetratricopeptide repeat protein [Nonomuraea ceibae]|uniref:tetratricopeptide repeat protein n=1 Tax=Nonomuraea ceibae TaxID=1935170 RepID=UPI001C5F8E03|nr:tetratricopeptide repeat protein [Nonomuraea ceibae]